MSPHLLLIFVAVFSIVALILLVTKLKLHPFLALLIVSIFMGLAGGLSPPDVIKNFEKGFGDVLSFVGIVVGLGAMLGGLLVASGGADRLANSLISLGGKKWVPWTTFFAAFLVGLPLFFEVGFVLLVPLAFAISKRMGEPILKVGLPMLAGLSIAHGFVPPHPGPTLAVQIFHADAGKTILYGLLVGLPTGLLAGPVFATLVSPWIRSGSVAAFATETNNDRVADTASDAKRLQKPEPSLTSVLTTILLPPVLMMGRSLADAFLPESGMKTLIDFLGDPINALLLALLFAIVALGLRQGSNLGQVENILGKSLGAIAAVVLIVGAGGGFKQMLLATKIGDLIGQWAAQAHISLILLAWLSAAVVRIATGSATVATITGAGIVAPIAQADPHANRELLVLATGAGSLILSHVNDAGFWLVKEYFQLSLSDTFKSWTAMETLLSILGLGFLLLLGLVV
ncbi:MAG TPA: gluconate:H+ symporter [Chthoniobacterales bacterium]|nr:gluconate:H+ symporter [Chthoniobacterales bacterium]